MRYVAVHLHQFQSDALQQLSQWQRTAEAFGKKMNDHLQWLDITQMIHMSSPKKLNNTPVLPDTWDLRYVLACQHFSWAADGPVLPASYPPQAWPLWM